MTRPFFVWHASKSHGLFDAQERVLLHVPRVDLRRLGEIRRSILVKYVPRLPG